MPAITITHSKSGAKADVHTFGATITSFTVPTDDGLSGSNDGDGRREVLFLSKDAKLDGSKAIRGGIPLVFPQFGQSLDATMAQHGFLRNNEWDVVTEESFDTDEAAGMSLSLSLRKNVDPMTRGETGFWASKEKQVDDDDDDSNSADCTVLMTFRINGSSLTQTLTIENTGLTKPFAFQTLFHTYYLVQDHQALDPHQCNVLGLEGYHCSDKITNEEYTLGSDPIVIDGNVDRVYTPPPQDERMAVKVIIKTGADTTANLEAHGTVDGKPVPTSCVVWNPHKEKAEAMGDFNNDGYHDMICCEPGLLDNVPELQPGQKCVFTQVISV